MAGVQRLDEVATSMVEPHVRGLASLHVPSVAIVDYAAVAAAIAAELLRARVEIRLHARVLRVAPGAAGVTITTEMGTFDAGRVIACAGLGSDALAREVGASPGMRIVPFRGDYYRLAPRRRDLVRGLVYPVPDSRFPFLGIHFTPRMDGEVLLGPNAVLAFGLEAYRRTDLDVGGTLGILGYRGFRTLAAKYWRTGLAEIVRDYSKARFLRALQLYMPELRSEDLVPGPSGIRAQAVADDGSMLDDFWYEATPRVLVVRNAPSPAATASLVLAREIVDRALAA